MEKDKDKSCSFLFCLYILTSREEWDEVRLVGREKERDISRVRSGGRGCWNDDVFFFSFRIYLLSFFLILDIRNHLFIYYFIPFHYSLDFYSSSPWSFSFSYPFPFSCLFPNRHV